LTEGGKVLLKNFITLQLLRPEEVSHPEKGKPEMEVDSHA
jgi:hypothetical protein